MNNIKHSFLVIIALFSLGACKSKNALDDNVEPVVVLYEEANAQLERGNYKKAALGFEKIFFQHPGNAITPRAELMQAYSLYLDKEFDEAVDILEIFIKLHPRHENIAYAYYLKALSNYVQISDVKLDQSRTRFALEGLEEVINRFPGSKYAIDAALKVDLVKDHLAGKEMLVGRYYQKRKNPIAAISRFQEVVEKYETTAHVTEALYRLVESNLMLGLDAEAKKYADVLEHNYPGSSWDKQAQHLLK